MLKKMLLETEDRASWIFQVVDERDGTIHDDPTRRAYNDRETCSRALTKFCDARPEFTGLPCETIALTRDEQDAHVSKLERLAQARSAQAKETAAEAAIKDPALVADSAEVTKVPVKFTEVAVRPGESIHEALERTEFEALEAEEKAAADKAKAESEKASSDETKPS